MLFSASKKCQLFNGKCLVNFKFLSNSGFKDTCFLVRFFRLCAGTVDMTTKASCDQK